MGRPIPVVALCVLLLFSGCTGFLGQETSESPTPGDTATQPATPTTTATRTPTATATRTATETPEPTKIIALTAAANETRASADVQRAIERWNNADADTVELRYTASDNSYDVAVEFTDTISECDGDTTVGTYFWCYDGDDTLRVANRYVDAHVAEFTLRGIGRVAGVSDPADSELATTIEEPQTYNPFLTRDAIKVTLVRRNGSVRPREAAALNATIAYWNRNADRYGNYPAEFRYVSSRDAADIVVRMTSDVPRCTDHEDVLGCAPILERDDIASEPAFVDIRSGYTQANTTEIMQHEFGHVLGIQHGEEPLPIMRANTTALLAGDVTDLEDRSYGFDQSTLRVYVVNESFDENIGTIYAEVREGIEWYNAGDLDETPDGFEMVMVDSKDRANLIVRENRFARCDGDYHWCTVPYSNDVDTDDAREYYSFAYINLWTEHDDETAYSFAKAAGVVITHQRTIDNAPPADVDDSEAAEWPE